MKKLVFFFGTWCLFLTLLGCAPNNPLQKQLQLLQNPPEYEYPLDSTGFSKIKKATFFAKNGDTGVFAINSSNIHLVDLNNDGQKDMIYQDNRHYQATVLLVKKGNDFVEIWNGSGALVDIKQGEKTTIFVLSSAIGCLNETILSELVIKNDGAIAEKTLGLHLNTEIKGINKTFEQKIISGILRTEAIIDDTKKKDPCTGDVKTGNQMRIIKNKEVTIIKKQSDWLLVVLKEKNQSIIGWVQI